MPYLSGMNERYFSTKQVSQLLQIERGTIYIWRNKGKIKMTKFDCQYYVAAEDLQPLIDERYKTGKIKSWTNILAVDKTTQNIGLESQ